MRSLPALGVAGVCMLLVGPLLVGSMPRDVFDAAPFFTAYGAAGVAAIFLGIGAVTLVRRAPLAALGLAIGAAALAYIVNGNIEWRDAAARWRYAPLYAPWETSPIAYGIAAVVSIAGLVEAARHELPASRGRATLAACGFAIAALAAIAFGVLSLACLSQYQLPYDPQRDVFFDFPAHAFVGRMLVAAPGAVVLGGGGLVLAAVGVARLGSRSLAFGVAALLIAIGGGVFAAEAAVTPALWRTQQIVDSLGLPRFSSLVCTIVAIGLLAGGALALHARRARYVAIALFLALGGGALYAIRYVGERPEDRLMPWLGVAAFAAAAALGIAAWTCARDDSRILSA
ncbi:MAG TPA: hypothetical protein VGM88_26490 [Kofleriaceae bacterium]